MLHCCRCPVHYCVYLHGGLHKLAALCRILEHSSISQAVKNEKSKSALSKYQAVRSTDKKSGEMRQHGYSFIFTSCRLLLLLMGNSSAKLFCLCLVSAPTTAAAVGLTDGTV